MSTPLFTDHNYKVFEWGTQYLSVIFLLHTVDWTERLFLTAKAVRHSISIVRGRVHYISTVIHVVDFCWQILTVMVYFQLSLAIGRNVNNTRPFSEHTELSVSKCYYIITLHFICCCIYMTIGKKIRNCQHFPIAVHEWVELLAYSRNQFGPLIVIFI